MTQNVLSKQGIESYISGCLTLTLPKFSNIMCTNQICLTDVDDEIYQLVQNSVDNPCIKITHSVDPVKYKKLSWKERKAKVISLLKTYQQSRLVITSRLHCALPCLALGVPVLMINSDAEDLKIRFSDYEKFIATMTKKEICNKNNLREYLQGLRKNHNEDLICSVINDIKSRVSNFVSIAENTPADIQVAEYYWYSMYKRQSQLFYSILNNQKEMVENVARLIIMRIGLIRQSNTTRTELKAQ